MNGRQGVTAIESCLQFAAHDEMGLIGIYRPAFIQKVGTGLGGIQENQPLSKDMNVDDFAYSKQVRRIQRRARGELDAPYDLDQSVTLSHS